jgi:hypothetical protein
MIIAKINENGIVLDTIVASLSDVLPEGNWVECPAWIGIGMHIDDPGPNAEQEETKPE